MYSGRGGCIQGGGVEGVFRGVERAFRGSRAYSGELVVSFIQKDKKENKRRKKIINNFWRKNGTKLKITFILFFTCRFQFELRNRL